MANFVKNDRGLHRQKSQKIDDIGDFLTIYAHPQVVESNLLLKKGIILVPLEKEKTNWFKKLGGK